jgi:uncharacterized protein
MSGSESPSNTPSTPKRKRGRPEGTSLEPYKDQIVKSFVEDNVPVIDIARRLNLEHGLDVSERTISRRLTTWQIPRKKVRYSNDQELRDRIVFHYNKNLSDDKIAEALKEEGYDIKTKSLGRLRQSLGMRRRSKYPEFREFSDEEGDQAPNEQLAAEAGMLLPVSKQGGKKPKKKMANDKALIPKVTAFVEQVSSPKMDSICT